MLVFTVFKTRKRVAIDAVYEFPVPLPKVEDMSESRECLFFNAELIIAKTADGVVHPYHVNTISSESDFHVSGTCVEGENAL